LFSYNSKHGWCDTCYGTGLALADTDAAQNDAEIPLQPWSENEMQMCPACHGQRLRPEALAVRFQNQSIAEYTQRSVESAERFFRGLRLRGREAAIAQTILAELRTRLAFLKTLGLAYLTLDRAAPTLSGGEAQRIRLAAQLGSNLRGVCYILDEPTIGLHPRDNQMLLNTLVKLEEKGNTVVVVEHDEDTIRRAEHVIDLGPGAGRNGGEVVAVGSVQALMDNPRSLTGGFLANPLRHRLNQGPPRRVLDKQENQLQVLDACLHNLNHLTVALPLGALVCVTGVSGSGKSTLVRDIIHDNLQRLLSNQRDRSRKATAPLLGCQDLLGWDTIQRVVEVDQTPIGKTPRSCPATYVGFWDNIRRLFAETPEARLRGYGPGRFSFNVRGGRCEACEGQGRKKIAMSFLPDVEVPCEICHGARFNTETLGVLFKDKNIGEVLAMSVDEAVDFFAVHTAVHHALRLLQDVGLGYLTLGQQSPTLSGGEAQRIKLVTELAKTKPHLDIRQNRRNHTLYVLDEPTVGLHMADVEKLIRVLHQLITAGNSVMVIEHNLDIVAEADWIIDLGPEGGHDGGRIVAQGTPQDVARVRKGSHTAKFLRKFLKERTVARKKVS
jgi:excinuclease ABC subunit A